MRQSAFRVLFSLVLLVISFHHGVNGQTLPLPKAPNTEKSEEIEELIDSELYVGAPAEAIEAFFERHRIAYTYNKFGNRYRAIVRDVFPDLAVVQSVVIRIDLDSERRFVGSDVSDHFTAR